MHHSQTNNYHVNKKYTRKEKQLPKTNSRLGGAMPVTSIEWGDKGQTTDI